MKNKARKRIVVFTAILLALLIVLPIVISALSAGAKASSKQELERLKNEAAYLVTQKERITQQIAENERQQAATIEKKTLLDQRIILTQDEITNANAQLQQYTILIAEKQADIDKGIIEEREMFETFRARMRALEENGTVSYWSLIFKATSYTELLDSIDIVNELLDSDQRVIDDLLEKRQFLADAQADLEESKAEQKAVKDQLVSLEQDLERQRAEADQLMLDLESRKEQLEESYAQMEEQEVLVAKAIDEMIARIEEEERLAALRNQSSGYRKGTGSIIWPTPSCYIITSEFGNRLHPTLGYYKFHTGVDIGASYGAKILAADDGTVITAGYNSGGYGNYVVISHGNGLTTLYGHMSSYAVSNGQNVSKGDVIGYVGSTGRSTGPHLHFEVRQSGQYIDPMSYFS
jgi:murein DD-endopeptidase MepM/ murein hydrolase activator NlpD